MLGKPLRTSTIPLLIGRNSFDGYAIGLIDDVRVWKEARTEGEIQRDLARRLTGKEASLVAWWKFDDKNGADTTGLGHTASVFGGPVFVADTSTPDLLIDTAVEVYFPVLFPSTTYRLQATDDLLNPDWTSVGSEFTGRYNGQAFESIRGKPSRYYRVVKE